MTFAIPPSKLIQVDIDPREIGKNYPVEVALVGDAQAALADLLAALGPGGGAGAYRDTRLLRRDPAAARPSWFAQVEIKSGVRGDADDDGPGRPRGPAGDERRRGRRHRRRPAAGDGQAALGDPPAADASDVRRLLDDGVHPAGGDRRPARPARPRGRSPSAATATSSRRCRSSRRPSSPGRRSARSSSTTPAGSASRAARRAFFGRSAWTDFLTPDGSVYSPDFAAIGAAFGIHSEAATPPRRGRAGRPPGAGVGRAVARPRQGRSQTWPSPAPTRPAGGTPRARRTIPSSTPAGWPVAPRSSTNERRSAGLVDPRPGDAGCGGRLAAGGRLGRAPDRRRCRSSGTTSTSRSSGSGRRPGTILDDIARTGYDGLPARSRLPGGRRAAGRPRAARTSAWPRSTPRSRRTVDGPTSGALDDGPRAAPPARRRRRRGARASPSTDRRTGTRSPAARPIPATPRLTDDGWTRDDRAPRDDLRRDPPAGARIAFHPHAGTYIETPAEVERLADSIDAGALPFCLDVGHYTVGGGDPVEALRRYGERVDPRPPQGRRSRGPRRPARRRGRRLRRGDPAAPVHRARRRRPRPRRRSSRVLAERRYDGWLMVEQDSGWPPPAESAAIGRRVLAAALRRSRRHARSRPGARRRRRDR